MPLIDSLHPFLTLSWKASKLYDSRLNSALPGSGLTRNEKDVLLFLHNNAPLDTAGDIIKYRSISKSLVAKSVASLTARGYLTQTPDTADARYVHLAITPAATKAVHALKEVQDSFFAVLEGALPPEERAAFVESLHHISDHIDGYL